MASSPDRPVSPAMRQPGHHEDNPFRDNEDSPLLSPTSAPEQQHMYDDYAGQGQDMTGPQETKSIGYLIVLTIGILGLQVAWATELSNGSPYLLSLGMSKSLMALVWIAGPLTGTLVQPCIGILSDNCRHPWGRRKPFMVGGAIATVISLLLLPWTREVVGGVLSWFGADPAAQGVQIFTIIVAVLFIYVLDIAVNSFQATLRAFIVDNAPSHQQESANAMASRLLGVGNIIGYVAGYADLPKHIRWLGRTQFQILSAIASIALSITVFISVICIRERDPRLDGPPSKAGRGLLSFFRKIFSSIKRLPPQTLKVCIVQLVSWIGFFPMLFYTSSYVGDVYVQPFLEENPHMTPQEINKLYEQATREGTFALLIFAITSLSTNVLLPFFIDPTYDKNTQASNRPAAANRQISKASNWLRYIVVPGLTLRRAWMVSQVLFGIAAFSTLGVSTVRGATAIIGVMGITWGLTLWAPFAIISAEISRLNELARLRKQRRAVAAIRTAASQINIGESSGSSDHHHSDREPTYAGDDGENLPADDGQQGRESFKTEGAGGDEEEEEEEEQNNGYDKKDEDEEEEEDDDDDNAGVMMGIHNMAISAPQFIATFISSIVFRILQKPRGVPGDRSMSVVFAIGGAFVLAASIVVHRIRDDVPVKNNKDEERAAV